MARTRTPRTEYTAGDPEAEIASAVDAFRRVLRRLRVVARQTELATGLTAAQLFVLTAVVESPGCSMNEIAHSTMTDRSSVAAVIERLADRGYVSRHQAADDRRRASIVITSEGRRAMRSASPPPTALLIAGLRGLPTEQLHGLSGGLLALTRAMGIANEPAGMLFDDSPGQPRGDAIDGRCHFPDGWDFGSLLLARDRRGIFLVPSGQSPLRVCAQPCSRSRI